MPTYYSWGADATTNDARIWHDYTTANTANVGYFQGEYTISLQDIWDAVFGVKSLAQLESEADWML